MKKTIKNRLHLKQRFHSLRMTEGTTLKSHILKYIILLNDIEMIDIKTDDEDKVMILLCLLPNSYKGFKEIILHSRDSLTLEDLKNNLLVKSDIDLDSNKAINHENVKNSDRNRSKSRHKNMICDFCKNKGHIKVNCFKLKEK
jgi:gag-polypeptide of LTR copia-type